VADCLVPEAAHIGDHPAAPPRRRSELRVASDARNRIDVVRHRGNSKLKRSQACRGSIGQMNYNSAYPIEGKACFRARQWRR
jgi:hypothetical protein